MLSYQKAPVAYYKVCIEEFHLSANKCDANQNRDFLPSKTGALPLHPKHISKGPTFTLKVNSPQLSSMQTYRPPWQYLSDQSN